MKKQSYCKLIFLREKIRYQREERERPVRVRDGGIIEQG